MFAAGSTQYLETGFDGTETNVGKIAVGLYNGMYAFGGWTNLNMVAGEIKNPKRFMNSYFMIFPQANYLSSCKRTEGR